MSHSCPNRTERDPIPSLVGAVKEGRRRVPLGSLDVHTHLEAGGQPPMTFHLVAPTITTAAPDLHNISSSSSSFQKPPVRGDSHPVRLSTYSSVLLGKEIWAVVRAFLLREGAAGGFKEGEKTKRTG